jgi:hypothetical protein
MEEKCSFLKMEEKIFFFCKMGKDMFLFLQIGKEYVLISAKCERKCSFSAKWERICFYFCKMGENMFLVLQNGRENINILFLNSSGKRLHNQLIRQMFQSRHFLNGSTLFSLIHDFPSMRDLNNSLV